MADTPRNWDNWSNERKERWKTNHPIEDWPSSDWAGTEDSDLFIPGPSGDFLGEDVWSADEDPDLAPAPEDFEDRIADAEAQWEADHSEPEPDLPADVEVTDDDGWAPLPDFLENPESHDPGTTIEEMHEDALDTYSDVQEAAAEGFPDNELINDLMAEHDADVAAEAAAAQAAADQLAILMEKAAADPNFIPFAPGTPEFEEYMAAQNQAAADAALTKAKESHAFWTLPNAQYDPKLQFRFKVVIPGMAYEDARATSEIGDSFADTKHIDKTGGFVWYAKTVDKPGYSLVNLTENTWLNAFTMADVQTTIDKPKFKTVSMTLIDPSYPNATRKLVRILRRSGLNEAKAVPIAMAYGGSRSKSYIKTVGDVQIMQLNADGETIETWTLVQAYPQDVSFGKLDYSSSDPVEISITWGYKAFKVDFPDIGKEKAYNYFRNAEDFGAATKAETKKEYSSQAKCKEAAGKHWTSMTDVERHTAQAARDFNLDTWKIGWCKDQF